MFAKLYETSLGQVVVLKQETEYNEPEVRFYFQPEGLGVCSFAFGYENWENQDVAFEAVNLEMAEAAAKEMNVFA